MSTVKEIDAQREVFVARRSVWATLEKFFLPLLPTDAVPQPPKGIKIRGTDQLVSEEVLRGVLEDIRGHVAAEDKQLETLGKKRIVGVTRGKGSKQKKRK